MIFSFSSTLDLLSEILIYFLPSNWLITDIKESVFHASFLVTLFLNNELGCGTDEKALIGILGQRNASQRKTIRDTYLQLYNDSLIDRINSQLSGDFRKAAILWALDPEKRDARLANEVLRSYRKGIHELQVLVEIACTSSRFHLLALKEAYHSLFKRSLDEHISSTVSMPLKMLLNAMMEAYRIGKNVDNMEAESFADLLHNAIKAKQLDDDDVIFFLSAHNIFQLRATFACYKQKYGNPIDKDIVKCGTGDFEYLFKVVIDCIDGPEKYFAYVINKAIVGHEIDNDSLTRVIVSRAEVDTMKIREEYSNMFKTNLDDDVFGNTSGYYRDFLMILLGAKV